MAYKVFLEVRVDFTRWNYDESSCTYNFDEMYVASSNTVNGVDRRDRNICTRFAEIITFIGNRIIGKLSRFLQRVIRIPRQKKAKCVNYKSIRNTES